MDWAVFLGLGATEIHKMGFSLEGCKSDTDKKADLENIAVNCRSRVGKVPQLQTLIESTEAQIVIGSESWLTPEIGSAEIFSKGQMVLRNDRINEKGGGVFIAITNGLAGRGGLGD